MIVCADSLVSTIEFMGSWMNSIKDAICNGAMLSRISLTNIGIFCIG